jgi:hypothetical protein
VLRVPLPLFLLVVAVVLTGGSVLGLFAPRAFAALLGFGVCASGIVRLTLGRAVDPGTEREVSAVFGCGAVLVGLVCFALAAKSTSAIVILGALCVAWLVGVLVRIVILIAMR